MKSVIALVAALALVTSAEAATKTTRSAKAKSAKMRVAAAKKSVKKPEVSDVSSAASDVQLSESAKLSEVKPVVQAKKWSAGVDVESYAPVQGLNEGTVGTAGLNDGETDYAAKVGYKIADTMTLQAATEWMQMWGQGDAEASTTLLDPSIRLAKSDLAKLGDVGISGQARLYFPVSEASQDKEQIAQIRLYATASREITKALSASFTLNPRIFVQQNDTYINAKGEEKNVDEFRLYSSAGLKYAFNDYFAVEQTLGLYQKWKTNTARGDYLDASTSVYITPVKWLELNAGIRQSDEATDTRKAGGGNLYNAKQSEYFLIGSFSI